MGILQTLGLKKRSAAEIAAGLKSKHDLAIKEEGLAKLRKQEKAFDNRIEKARHTAQPTPRPHSAHRSMSMGGMFGGGGFGGAPQGGGGLGGQSQYFDSMFSPPKKAAPKRRKKKKTQKYIMVKV